MNKDVLMRPLEVSDLPELEIFTDQEIGDNYYSLEQLASVQKRAIKNGANASFIVRNEGGQGKIVAARLTLAPGQWLDLDDHGTTPEAWRVDRHTVAYFKSLFINQEFQGMGLGPKLSAMSIEAIKKQGGMAIICHSWLQSPGNTSQKYLTKMGFLPVQRHPLFWHHIDYRCTVCGDKRCDCTAEEMILYLN